MIAAANRSCAASDLSGPMSRARPSQLTHSIATTVTTAGGTHHHRISTRPMMPRAPRRDPASNTPSPKGDVADRMVHPRAMSYPDAIYHGDSGEVSARLRAHRHTRRPSSTPTARRSTTSRPAPAPTATSASTAGTWRPGRAGRDLHFHRRSASRSSSCPARSPWATARRPWPPAGRPPLRAPGWPAQLQERHRRAGVDAAAVHPRAPRARATSRACSSSRRARR